MKIPEKGLKREEIMQTLQAFKQRDLDWKSGKVFGFIYYPGDEAMDVINEAYTMYLTENGLDPTSIPSILKIENELVGMIADLLRGDESVVGNFTFGGTESIMMTVLAARNRARLLHPEIKEPEMIVPFTAHAAFFKAAHYLCVKPVISPVDDVTFRADVSAMRELITPNTILLVGSAPSYAHGVVDPIPEIGQLALEKDLPFHVDACVGGIHLAFMRKLGMDVPAYDFSVPGVTSISTDLHKYGYCAKPASLILYRDKDMRRNQIFACSSWPGYTIVNPVASSSKSGGSFAGAWALINFIGQEGYKKLVKEVMDATKLVIDGINGIDGLVVNGKPDMCMFSFISTDERVNVYRLADEMKIRGGWYLQPQFARGNSKSNIHVSFSDATVQQAEALLKDLKETVEILRNENRPAQKMDFGAMLKNVDLKLDESTFTAMMQMVGMSGDEAPERMEDINNILENLPVDLCEFILVTFMNNLMKPC